MMARSRPIVWPPPAGSRCWVDNRNSRLPLPSGLADREVMTLLALDGALCRLSRMDGAQFTLDIKQVHFPCELQVNGEWLPETHPAVIQSMRDWIATLREKGAGKRTAAEVEEMIADLEWVIRRNGG